MSFILSPAACEDSLVVVPDKAEVYIVDGIQVALSGEQWQLWGEQLINRRYGPGEYQRVPDKDRGDAGIEGFTISTGHAYQMYNPEEPLSTEERYVKHRDKITRDIKKFITNDKVLLRLFGNVKIKRWILLVPSFDSKRLVQHASDKTEEVVLAHLPYIDPTFRVLIEDEDSFAHERDLLLNTAAKKLDITPESISDEELDTWSADNEKLMLVLDQKLSKVTDSPVKKKHLKKQILMHFLQGQNMVANLRKYPTTYETLVKIKSDKELYLSTESLITDLPPLRFISQLQDSIKHNISPGWLVLWIAESSRRPFKKDQIIRIKSLAEMLVGRSNPSRVGL